MSDTVFVQVDGASRPRTRLGSARPARTCLVAGSAIFWQDEPAAAYVDLTAMVAEVPDDVSSRPRPDNHVIVLFGATGDLSKRKLLPGLFNLHCTASCPRTTA